MNLLNIPNRLDRLSFSIIFVVESQTAGHSIKPHHAPLYVFYVKINDNKQAARLCFFDSDITRLNSDLGSGLMIYGVHLLESNGHLRSCHRCARKRYTIGYYLIPVESNLDLYPSNSCLTRLNTSYQSPITSYQLPASFEYKFP